MFKLLEAPPATATQQDGTHQGNQLNTLARQLSGEKSQRPQTAQQPKTSSDTRLLWLTGWHPGPHHTAQMHTKQAVQALQEPAQPPEPCKARINAFHSTIEQNHHKRDLSAILKVWVV